MKKILAALIFILGAVTAWAALPVTRNFNAGSGTVPIAGQEDQWAYNRSASQTFTVTAIGNLFLNATDATQDVAMHWTGDTFGVNHCSTTVMNVISTNGSGVGRGYGPGVRMDTSTTQKTYVGLVGDSHGWELARFNNGAFTSLTTDTTAFVVGHTIKLCVRKSGANDIYTFTDNGVAMVGSPFTDTSPLTGGAPGVVHSSQTSSGGSQGIDSWTGENLGGRGVGPVVFH